MTTTFSFHLLANVQSGKMVNMTTDELKSELYFKQRISIELQRTNAASVMGTFDTSAKLDEILSTNMC